MNHHPTVFPSPSPQELDATTLADVRAFLSSLLGDASHTCHLEALVHGNVPPRATLDLARSVRSVLGPCATPASARPLERAVELPAGGPLLHRAGVRNGEEENSVAEVYRQAGRDGVRARALVDLVEQLVGEPCYDTLRTKEQLGYSVHSGMRLTHGLLGFAVVVVSGTRGKGGHDGSFWGVGRLWGEGGGRRGIGVHDTPSLRKSLGTTEE